MRNAQSQVGPAWRLQLPDLSIRAAAEPSAHEISVFVTYHRSRFQAILQAVGLGDRSPILFHLVAVSSAHKETPNYVIRTRDEKPEEIRPGQTRVITLSFGSPPRSAPEGEHWYFAAVEARADRPEATYTNNSIYMHYFLIR
jgi:hypothetical protein